MRKLVQTLRQKAGGAKRIEGGDVTHRVSVSAGEGWSKRNFGFLQRVALPAIFTPRRHTYSSRVFPTPAVGKLRLTWIGHASFLVQTERHNVLVDPNFAMWLGFLKRLRKPGVEIERLPGIDYILITHAHFDHLNIRSLRAIGTDIPVVVPGGVAKLLRRRGFTEVHELDYWESFKPGGDLEIRLTPTQHWGARFLHDTHRRFGAYLIRQGARQVFHCGDSAYFDGFTEIGERAGKIDVALMPIGAYENLSGSEVHMNPEEAVRAFGEMRAQTMVPMHYATFPLSCEPVHEPLERMRRAAAEAGVANRVRILQEGQPEQF